MSEWSPFIASQQWSLLCETESPQQYLSTNSVRGAGIQPPTAGDAATQVDPWIPIDDREDVIRNRLNVPDMGGPVDLSRLVITTDAGIGKSVGMDWLRAGIMQHDLQRQQFKSGSPPETSSGWIAVIVPARVLREGDPEQVNVRIMDHITIEIQSNLCDNEHDVDPAICRELVERNRRFGRIALLFDGLDQLGDCEALANAVKSPYWKDCHIVIAGRPFALQRDWHKLFNDSHWRFIRVEEFSAAQQTRYLGNDRNGKPKIKRIPLEARSILTVPRVLYYIRELPDSKLSGLKTAADVYYLAIYELIKRGMEKSVTARQMGCADKIPERVQDRAILLAMQMLSRIAFDMVSRKINVAVPGSDGEPSWALRPNFYRVVRGKMPKLLERLEKQHPNKSFDRDWAALSALNSVLAHAVFDADVEGLVEVEFRNRSLQEFLCAYYLCQHAWPDGDDTNLFGTSDRLSDQLGEWIYQPFDAESGEYYHVWQFVTEMPDDTGDLDVWQRSIEPLYRRAVQYENGQWQANRSCEMIFRSCTRFDHFCQQNDQVAVHIRDHWWTEFEQEILSGNRGQELLRCGEALQNSFITIPAGSYQMGAPVDDDRQLPEYAQQFYQRFLDDAPSEGQTEYIRETIKGLNIAPGRAGEPRREFYRSFLPRVLQQGMSLVTSHYLRADEHQHDVSVDEFQLSRQPCSNEWLRMFAPDHGDSSLIANEYNRYSSQSNQPAIYVSWFDAWAFCQWARWDQIRCRLPWEHEWEYACKYGTPDEWQYWWHKTEFDETLANANMQLSKTNPPDSGHVNPKTIDLDPGGIGLRDMLGNVMEWCQDMYREKHEWRSSDDLGTVSRSRVSRGGSFIVNSDDCRSAFRNFRLPSICGNFVGVRLARARKS